MSAKEKKRVAVKIIGVTLQYTGDPGTVLQRDSPTRFLTSSFFHHSNQPGPLINGFKYFRFWSRFCWVFQTLVSKKLTRRGTTCMIPYPPREIDSPGYHTQGVMFWGMFYWLIRVWYPGELDSQGYDTPEDWLARVGMIPSKIDSRG